MHSITLSEFNYHTFILSYKLKPEGGVKAGQVFLVPKPQGFPSDMKKVRVPVGRWKDGLFDCFKLGAFHPLLWLSFFCSECKFYKTFSP